MTHLESRTPGRFAKVVRNRRLFLDRWGDDAPRDDSRLWADRGFDVVGHEIRTVVDEDRRLCTPEPVLVRSPGARASVVEGAAAAALGDQEPRDARRVGRLVGRHALRQLPGGVPALARAGGGHRPPRRVLPAQQPPRRRRSHPARPVGVPPVVRPGQPRLGDLPPGDGVPRRGHGLRPRPGREHLLVRADVAAVGDPRRAAAPGHRAGAVPPGPRRAGHRPRRAVRRRVPRRAPADGAATPSRSDSRSPSTASSGRTSSRPRFLAGPVRAQRPARGDVRRGRCGPQRPLGRHAGRRLRLEPAVRRRRLRGPGRHRRRRRSRRPLRGLGAGGARRRRARPRWSAPTTWTGCSGPGRSAAPSPTGYVASTRSCTAPGGCSRSRSRSAPSRASRR